MTNTTTGTCVPSRPDGRRAPAWADRTAGWLRAGRGGLLLLALLVGAGSGLGAVAFRYLISFFTWLATGHSEFGQQGYTGSAHLPWLGLGFFVVIPVIGGLIYGPLIYRYAREARGHGVPEVMIAVADNGGRIRPQVSVVKAVASAVCIAVGGSVGREGPIVQIGSALASSVGQWVKMPESRLRILVACGAGGGIAATFNAPITGVFFGVEIILREFSVDALFTVMLSAMVADVIGREFLSSAPFLSGFPAGIALHHARTYLLVAVLAVIAGLIGLAFSKVVYLIEDLWDRWWKNRPEWARPAVGGVALGLLLLAIPQMYGVGYPVMYKTVSGGYVLWFLLLLAVAKIAACSLTLGIGGSGGIFAPSLFIGVTSGYAFGDIAGHIFGPGAGQPALYAVVAMGAVFASAARAPLTSLASVVEMTGNFAITLPVMLAVAIACTVSRALSYGTIYTTKLLRRGTDIDRAAPWRALQDLKVADAMRPFRPPLDTPPPQDAVTVTANGAGPDWAALAGPVTGQHDPQALFATESLTQTLRQLEVYGRDGLPVLSADGEQVQGWVTGASVLRAIARQIGTAQAEATQAQLTADGEHADEASLLRRPPAPLSGYQVIELAVRGASPADGARLGAVAWPEGTVPVSVLRDRSHTDADPSITLRPGDRISLLVPAADPATPAAERADLAGHGTDQENPSSGRRPPESAAQAMLNVPVIPEPGTQPSG
ncbi:MAG: chloride channel protein [Actinomycetota bacterium]|nr:chloride channel protein [Actinomycetota bacterium]